MNNDSKLNRGLLADAENRERRASFDLETARAICSPDGMKAQRELASARADVSKFKAIQGEHDK